MKRLFKAIVNRGEENRLFTMAGLTKRSNHGKNKAAQKDVIRDAKEILGHDNNSLSCLAIVT